MIQEDFFHVILIEIKIPSALQISFLQIKAQIAYGTIYIQIARIRLELYSTFIIYILFIQLKFSLKISNWFMKLKIIHLRLVINSIFLTPSLLVENCKAKLPLSCELTRLRGQQMIETRNQGENSHKSYSDFEIILYSIYIIIKINLVKISIL